MSAIWYESTSTSFIEMLMQVWTKILQCLQQMIQLRVQNMRSGWRTMFGVFSAASHVQTGKYRYHSIVSSLNSSLFLCYRTYCQCSLWNRHQAQPKSFLRHRPTWLICRSHRLHHRLLQSEQVSEDQFTGDWDVTRGNTYHAQVTWYAPQHHARTFRRSQWPPTIGRPNGKILVPSSF